MNNNRASPYLNPGYYLPNPDEISRGDVFDLATPDLSKDAQIYCAKYVKAPLLAYAEYKKLPNLALQMKTEKVKVGDCVEIMMSNILEVKATARGVVVQSSGATKNGINLRKQRFLVNVT